MGPEGIDLFDAIAGERIEIRVRHELQPFQRELLTRLGATYVIDPAAPRCARPCPEEECMATDAELRRALDLPLGHHPNARPLTAQQAEEGRRLLEAMDRGESLSTVAAGNGSSTETCKVPGCTKPYAQTHGRWAKLCSEHKAEKLAAARAEGSLGTTGSQPAKPPPAAPPSEPEVAEHLSLEPTVAGLRAIANDEQIAYHERESLRHATLRDLLTQIKDELERV